MATRSPLLHPAAKPLAFALGIEPLCQLLWELASGTLGANPVEALVRSTGDWSLRFTCLVLLVTPLRVISGAVALARFRRMLGLFSAFYSTVHLLVYAWLDRWWAGVIDDVLAHRYLLVGMAAWLLMLPLAATSFNRAIKALGARRWQALHRTTYGMAVLAASHFILLRASKNDLTEPAVYGLVLLLLLGWRAARALAGSLRQRRARIAGAAPRIFSNHQGRARQHSVHP